ncbi:hypothetical protein [Polaribacter aquimarinus]|uniref:Uncharacterized protein n=1 Tax=Polaribacter aquimarinus TaxID=2100726 RepID=A0A2U2J6R3_9FLAO|nr:hypothetical protein [Polaribacter aquimarinus]PWG04033.1 hypothetical protein DIS07_14875 [Polaribacter aquimarinus]
MKTGILLIVVGVFFYFWNKKVIFYKDRNGKEKIIGEFIKYESVTEKVLRNENHTSFYPFVKINLENGESGVFKLNFRNQLGKSFNKGEKIELFWCNNELLYWKAYEVGILKYLPKKWLF